MATVVGVTWWCHRQNVNLKPLRSDAGFGATIINAGRGLADPPEALTLSDPATGSFRCAAGGGYTRRRKH
jgi:hypothetical protein